MIEYKILDKLLREYRVRPDYSQHAKSSLRFCESPEEARANIKTLLTTRPEWFGRRHESIY